MPDYVLSGKADEDLTEIYLYSYHQFGEARADAYLQSLEECFALLSDQPRLGRKVDHIRPGYLRDEHWEHSIFYKRRSNGILIMRVLRKGRDVSRYL